MSKNELFNRLYELISEELRENKILIFGSSVNSVDFNDIDLFLIAGNDKIGIKLKNFMKTYDVKIHIIKILDKNLTTTFINELKSKHIMFNNHDYFLRMIYKNEL